MHVYIFMDRSFPQHDLGTWHWHCNLDFWIDTYCILEKNFVYNSQLYTTTLTTVYAFNMKDISVPLVVYSMSHLL